MPINMNNMTIFKSPKYLCFRICNVDDAKVMLLLNVVCYHFCIEWACFPGHDQEGEIISKKQDKVYE